MLVRYAQMTLMFYLVWLERIKCVKCSSACIECEKRIRDTTPTNTQPKTHLKIKIIKMKLKMKLHSWAKCNTKYSFHSILRRIPHTATAAEKWCLIKAVNEFSSLFMALLLSSRMVVAQFNGDFIQDVFLSIRRLCSRSLAHSFHMHACMQRICENSLFRHA